VIFALAFLLSKFKGLARPVFESFTEVRFSIALSRFTVVAAIVSCPTTDGQQALNLTSSGE
jgi:hypothetical protein